MKTIIEQDAKSAANRDQTTDLRPERSGENGHLSSGRLRRLHRAIGNQAVQRVLTQRQAAREPIQRDEEDAAQADDGTITIQEVQTNYYDVTGTTLTEVSEQLDPTEWGQCHYHYSYPYETTNGRTTKVNIVLTLTVRLPRWQGAGWNAASEAAKTEWRRMLQALETHEEGHSAIARSWAPTIKERLLDQSEGDVQTEYNTVLAEVVTEQNQYDADTNHGQTQGVSLDLSVDEEQSEQESDQVEMRGGGLDLGF